MTLFKSIVCECNYCGTTELLTLTKSMSEAKQKLLKWGWVFENKKHFCNKDCKDYFDKEECLTESAKQKIFNT